MDKVNIGIIILNYFAYQETIQCVDSILKQDQKDCNIKIVVVDNHSLNQSYRILKKKYDSQDNIKIIRTNKNLGFARGNNCGYSFLKNKMNLDFVVVSNSDAYAKKEGLFKWIISEYRKEKFGVLGPSIFSKRGNFYQSPMENETKNIKNIEKQISDLKKYLIKLWLKKLFPFKNSEEVPRWKNSLYDKRSVKYTLHGAFQIFSKRYLENYNNLYDKRTFLYREEDILRIRCEKKNLPMVYSPNYKVEHMQAVSTNKVAKSSLDQKINRTRNFLNSTKVYEKVLKESNLAK